MNHISMSHKELDRHDIIQRVIRKELKGVEAARLLNLSPRHIKRLKAKVKRWGAKGLVHAHRGQKSNHALSVKEREHIEHLLKTRYRDFGPTFATEKLGELHDITHDPKTIRAIMIDGGLWKPHIRHHDEHRAWRARKDAYGEMEQFDGSYHQWLEDRYPHELCLLLSIDDATGTITKACFAPHEGVFPVMSFWHDYCLKQGKPRSIYLDRFSTYMMTQRVASENHDTKTQFQRACGELGIELITAHSPEAKGRVERVFLTLQDRLVKEMRLKSISSVKDANHFLISAFIPWFNKRYAVTPQNVADLHRAVLGTQARSDLDTIFSRQETRVVQNDFTVSFKNQWYQLLAKQPVTVCKRDTIIIEERIDGTIAFRLRGKYLAVLTLPARPHRTRFIPWVLAKTIA